MTTQAERLARIETLVEGIAVSTRMEGRAEYPSTSHVGPGKSQGEMAD